MADFDVEDRDIERFYRELERLERAFPREARKIMMRSGTKARAIVAKKARQLVRKETGNYLKSIKRGKVWRAGGEFKVRVYTGAPHGHLIEYGHRIVDKAGVERGFKEGYHVFEKSAAEIERQWVDILESEFHRILDKL